MSKIEQESWTDDHCTMLKYKTSMLEDEATMLHCQVRQKFCWSNVESQNMNFDGDTTLYPCSVRAAPFVTTKQNKNLWPSE